jgi:hypothetical protein
VRVCRTGAVEGAHAARIAVIPPEPRFAALTFLISGALSVALLAAQAPPSEPTNLRIVEAGSDSMVVGFDDVTTAVFEAIPLGPVQALRVMSVDRSVGANISQGLTDCLSVSDADAISGCKRWAWLDGSYAAPPITWTAHPLPNWQYFTWPGQTAPGLPELPCSDDSSKTACFESYLAVHAGGWDVVSMQPSYLEAGTYGLTADDYLASYELIKAAHPHLTVILHTASLARTIGTAENAAFNQAVRDYVNVNGGILLDVADIEMHDPDGTPNLLGGYPILSPYYCSEPGGGHLGYPSTGKIRLAMAWWITLGQIVAQ